MYCRQAASSVSYMVHMGKKIYDDRYRYIYWKKAKYILLLML